jgi:predicted esterase
MVSNKGNSTTTLLMLLGSLIVISACGTAQPLETAPTPVATFPVPEPPAPAPTPTPEPTPPTPTATPVPTPTEPPLVPALLPGAPDYCVAAEPAKLQEIKRTPAGPFFVHHPETTDGNNPTVIFIPGGNGTERGAERVWDNYLSNGSGVERFRLVIPYSPDEVGFMGEARLIVAILDEVLACYGGDAAKVHVAGMSNGGHAAFETMLAFPERFATLLGAPGSFPTDDPAEWAKALGDRPVFNGVGSNDDEWIPEVKATHDALVAEGVESVFIEFKGQRHSVRSEFDESVFFDFWTSH